MPPGAVVVLTAAASAGPVDALLRAGIDGDRMLWDGRADGGPSLAGVGATAVTEADGEGALATVRAAGIALLNGLVLRTDDGVDAPSPALLGGSAFHPGAPRDAVWAGFADASFVLPRWVYGRQGDRGFLRLALRAGELADGDRVLAEVRRVQAALATASPAGVAPRMDAQVEELARPRWDALVDGALTAIRGGAVEKLVVARRCRIVASRPFDPVAAVLQAGAVDLDVACFAVERSGRSFVAATPERLVVLRGGTASVDALAGSAARGAVGAPAALMTSDKDRREHAMVVDAVRDALAPFCAGEPHVPAQPVVRTLRHLHHLWTPVRAAVGVGTHVLDLAAALHPTPAVAGRPRRASMAWIAANEPVGRGWYAGPVGWFDAAGDGALVVALRSAVVAGREAWIYAGAGVVLGSTAAGEWAETATKQRAMRSALGVEA